MNPEWHAVQSWATERLAASRQKLESALDPVQTEHTRGRIAVLKELIALPGTLKSLSDARFSNGGPE